MKMNIGALAVLATTAAAAPLGAVNTNATGIAAAPNGTHPIEPCVMPNGCRDEKHDKHFMVPTKTLHGRKPSSAAETAAPSGTPPPVTVHPIPPPVVNPTDAPASVVTPPRPTKPVFCIPSYACQGVSQVTTITTKTRTFSVPTETSSRSRGDAWLPVPPKTTKTSSIETEFSWLLPVPTKTSGVITYSP